MPKTESLKICFILEHFYPQVGGVETEFWEFSTRLVLAGCQVRVITSDSGGISGTRAYEGVSVWHMPWMSIFGHPLPRAKDLLEHVSWADVVHTTTYTAAPVAASVSKRLGKPCVLTVQECLGKRWFSLGESPLTATLFYIFERFVLSRSFDRWHCISQATAKDVLSLGIPNERVKPILLGIDDALYNSPPKPINPAELFEFEPSKKVLLFFGRAGKTKGISILLNAVKLLEPELPPDFVFGLILGSHPAKEREKYAQKVIQLRLSEKVKIVPSVRREELLGYIQGAHVVITPSITEGFGFSAAETCALGTAVISSNSGSLPEVVSGKHLFFENRSAADLAQKLRLALQGRFDYVPTRKFSWDVATEELLTLYLSVVGVATSAQVDVCRQSR